MAATFNRRAASAALLALLCGACVGPQAERPDADADATTTGRELRTSMHEMWFYLIELDYALLDPPQPQDVRFTLGELRRVAGDIDDDSVSELHPWFPPERERFVATIEQAQRAAAEDPPDFAATMIVFDGCARCHAVRDLSGR